MSQREQDADERGRPTSGMMIAEAEVEAELAAAWNVGYESVGHFKKSAHRGWDAERSAFSRKISSDPPDWQPVPFSFQH